MEKEIRKTLERAVAVFGTDAQEKMVIEEMAELQKEICKRWRGSDNLPELSEEIADLEIMLGQLKIMHGVEEAVEFYKREKLRKLEQKIESHEVRT